MKSGDGDLSFWRNKFLTEKKNESELTGIILYTENRIEKSEAWCQLADLFRENKGKPPYYLLSNILKNEPRFQSRIINLVAEIHPALAKEELRKMTRSQLCQKLKNL